jgi:hypothetical protein
VNQQVIIQNMRLSYLLCHLVFLRTLNGIAVSDLLISYVWNIFILNLDQELYRLNKMSLPSSDTYDPLLPILWMTM